MKDYTTILTSKYDYTEYEAVLTNTDLNNMDVESIIVLEGFFNGKNADCYSFRDVSVKLLIEEYNLSPIAAILSIDKLKKDYNGYMKILNYNK